MEKTDVELLTDAINKSLIQVNRELNIVYVRLDKNEKELKLYKDRYIEIINKKTDNSLLFTYLCLSVILIGLNIYLIFSR